MITGLKNTCVDFAKTTGKWFGNLLAGLKDFVSGADVSGAVKSLKDSSENGLKVTKGSFESFGASVRSMEVSARDGTNKTRNVFESFATNVKNIFSNLKAWLSENASPGKIFAAIMAPILDLFSAVIDTLVKLVNIISEKVNLAKVMAVGAAGAIIYSFKRMLDIAETSQKGLPP